MWRLRWRTAVAGAFVFVVPFMLFYFLMGTASERYIRNQTSERLRSAVATNANLLDDVFEVRMAEIQSLAEAVSHLPSRPASRAALLRAFVEANPWYWLLAVADRQGDLVAASEPLDGNVSDRDYFRAALAGRTLLSDVFLSPLTRQGEIVVAAPLRRGGTEVTGVLIAALRLEKLNHRLLNPGVGATGQTFLLNSDARLATPMPPAHLLLGQAFDPRESNTLRNAAGVGHYHDPQGRPVLVAYHQLLNRNLYVAAQVAESEVLAQVQKLRWSILFYLSPFLALGVVLAVGAWHYALRYVTRLTDEVCQALDVARERERERDLAHQELARRFEEERDLARQKVQFQAQLADYEKSAALAQLALGAAHEINNPLLGILAHLELELRQASGDDERAEIEQCIEAGRRISTTLHGLLNYARPGPLQLTTIRLDQLVTDTLAFLRRHPLFRGKQLEKQIAPGLPRITADANQVSQMLMNLLLNAADATPEGGTITVSAAPLESGDQVEIRVCDTGSGIPEDILPHVFDPFFTTKRGRGTGLGLSITQAYLRSHHGDIEIDSQSGAGTSVRLVLPTEQAEQQPAPQTPEVVA